MPKRTKTSVKNACDRLWGKIIRVMFPICIKCGQTYQLASHHVFGRRNSATRHDLTNGVSLCAGDHTFRPDSFHQAPYHPTNLQALRKNGIDDKELERLGHKSREVVKMSLPDYLDLEKELNRKLKEYE